MAFRPRATHPFTAVVISWESPFSVGDEHCRSAFSLRCRAMIAAIGQVGDPRSTSAECAKYIYGAEFGILALVLEILGALQAAGSESDRRSVTLGKIDDRRVCASKLSHDLARAAARASTEAKTHLYLAIFQRKSHAMRRRAYSQLRRHRRLWRRELRHHGNPIFPLCAKVTIRRRSCERNRDQSASVSI